MSSKLKFLYLIFIFFWWHTSFSQTYNQSYLFGKIGSKFNSVLLFDDTLVNFGFVTEPFRPYPVKYAVSKMGMDGSQYRTYTSIFDSFVDYFSDGKLILTSDSCFAFLCSGYNNACLIKIGRNGDLVYRKVYNIQYEYFIFHDIVELPDSGFMLMGCETYSPSASYSVLIRVSANGDSLWTKKYNLQTEILPHLVKLKDGNLLLSSTSTNNRGILAPFQGIFRKLNLNGDVLSTWYDSDKKSAGATSFYEFDDGSDLYCNFYNDTIYSTSGGGTVPTFFYGNFGQIVRRDYFGNKVWTLKLGDTRHLNEFTFLNRLKDGNFLVVGQKSIDDHNGQARGWIVKFDPYGNVIWDRSYINTSDSGAAYHQFNHFVELDNGDIIAVGERRHAYENYPQQAWMVRLDSDGCLVPGCGTIGIKDENREPAVASVFPNPVENEMNLNFDVLNEYINEDYDVDISSIDGRSIYQLPKLQKSTSYVIDATNFPTGVLLLQLKKNKKILSTQKIIKL